MEASHEFRTWRELLGHAIKNPQERARLMREIDVKYITLRRWVSGESQPRDENIRRLARSFAPDLSTLFLRLIAVEFPAFVREKFEPDAFAPEVPAELYMQMFQIYTKKPPHLSGQALQEILLERALEHLDPDRLGLCLTFAICVPPVAGRKVRSLRQVSGTGTSPWQRNLERTTIFLGTESLAGNAVMAAEMIYVKSRESNPPCPIQWTTHEQSAVAMPVMRQGKIAGVLLASSTQPHYFTLVHRNLLELYAHLAMLIFLPDEFYTLKEIQLGKLPDYERQKPYFVDFEQRVLLKEGEAMASGGYLSLQQAQQEVWREIADELLRLENAS